MAFRYFLFCIGLIIFWLPGLSLIFYVKNFFQLGNSLLGNIVLSAIAVAGPIISSDASLLGDITPAALAAALILLGPKPTEWGFIYVSIAICAIGWAIYTYLSTMFSTGTPEYEAITTLLEVHAPAENSMNTLQAFTTGTRILFVGVGAGLAGFKLRTTNAAT